VISTWLFEFFHSLRDPEAAASPARVQAHFEWYLDDLELFPPMQQTRPALWTAARTPASAERAATRGWKVCAGFNSTEVVAEMFDGYRKVAGDAGHPTGPDRLGLRRMVTFIDGPDNKRLGMHIAKKSLLDVLNASAGPLPPFAALLDRPDEDMAMMSNDEFFSGSPDEVAAELIRQCRAVGASNMLVTFSAIEPAELAVAHEVFAREVLPQLHGVEL
jgi:alkanesulfonate monooxygenase SsuD/methylene tetrahydromethanopterin reductase-like flavin-dependent oxidoreductase (luciferase family)